MTIEEARRIVANQAKLFKEDFEVANALEGELLRAAVDAVIAGHPDALELCLLAKQSTLVDGPRYCA